MKKTILIIFAILSGFVTSGFTIVKPGTLSLIINHRKIEVVFNRKTTFDQLVRIKSDLHQKHIDINFKTIEFDDNHELTKISFSVDCNDGFKGSASSGTLNNNSKFGFFRDYTKNAASPFGTGGIN